MHQLCFDCSKSNIAVFKDGIDLEISTVNQCLFVCLFVYLFFGLKWIIKTFGLLEKVSITIFDTKQHKNWACAVYDLCHFYLHEEESACIHLKMKKRLKLYHIKLYFYRMFSKKNDDSSQCKCRTHWRHRFFHFQNWLCLFFQCESLKLKCHNVQTAVITQSNN